MASSITPITSLFSDMDGREHGLFAGLRHEGNAASSIAPIEPAVNKSRGRQGEEEGRALAGL
jgi:hypothetical protein